MLKVRCNIHRMSYTVDPGLYALGNPDRQSDILVSANYKLSFDLLRKELTGRNFWLLVLDTRGINVWCAAGKGTFGTEELIRRAVFTRISELTLHNRLILPQLATPGISAHIVKKKPGFTVLYGPILSRDLPRYLYSGKTATPAMRRKSFPLTERAALVPVELIGFSKWAFIIAVALFLLGGLGSRGDFWDNAFSHGTYAAGALLSACMAGGILVPLLLPWLPGRAFSFKGISAGTAAAMLYFGPRLSSLTKLHQVLEFMGLFLAVCALRCALMPYLILIRVGPKSAIGTPVWNAVPEPEIARWAPSR